MQITIAHRYVKGGFPDTEPTLHRIPSWSAKAFLQLNPSIGDRIDWPTEADPTVRVRGRVVTRALSADAVMVFVEECRP